ncbi:hypothetical protein [Tenacibaculum sp. 190524A02b]|uniref:hypothetical protein n=1 Tax=Tenacibaculum vairaonense TaxID=3137860 RepID=UPI0031FAC2D7
MSKRFKTSIFLLLLTGALWAQKVDKKFNERFYTNKDVVIDINANNADIEVTTWNKNEVAVEAIIEVEGMNKKEAEEYLNNWNFEALGNKNTVKIKATSNNFYNFGRDNFVYYNTHHKYPENCNSSNKNECAHPVIADIPEINIDVEEIVSGLEDIEFDFEKYEDDGDVYFYDWKDGVNSITIKSKEDWEKFKKSKEYKKFKERTKRAKRSKKRDKKAKELRKRAEELRKKNAEKRKVRAGVRRIKADEMKRALQEAKEALKHVQFGYMSSDHGNLMINGKKVKITKKITVKVPKGATFNLNTRHCKVKLPKTKVNGKVSYGNFKADAINGGSLNISFSPVSINVLDKSILVLNNVTDAKLASVTNTKVNAKSSGLNIAYVKSNVEVDNKFGELVIEKIHPNFQTLKVSLNYANAVINLEGANKELEYIIGDKHPYYHHKPITKLIVNTDDKKSINGSFKIIATDKTITIKGKHSQLKTYE